MDFNIFFFGAVNNASTEDDNLCLTLLAETHLKLRAFTLAEYYYTKIKAMNVKYLESMVQQKSTTKCQEVIALTSVVKNDSTLTDEEKQQLIEIHVKYGKLFVFKLNSNFNNFVTFLCV